MTFIQNKVSENCVHLEIMVIRIYQTQILLLLCIGNDIDIN